MRRKLLEICFFIVASTMLCCCGDTQSQKKWIGTWVLVKEWHPGGYAYDFPTVDSASVLQFFPNDSVTYICKVQFLKDAINIIPSQMYSYSCIDKGNGEYIYFEGDGQLPLRFLNDSTLMIQRWGVRYTMARTDSISIIKNNESKIVDFLSSCDYNKPDQDKRLFISNTEKELRKANHTLYYIVFILLAIAIAIVVYTIRIRRHAKYLSERLQAIAEEHDLRPEKVNKVLKEVENDFFISDYYASIHERIAKGENLTGKDWTDMKKHLNQIYPNFTSRLLELVNMSEVELQVCLLIKLRVTPKEMANVLHRDSSSISTIRSRLYKKVFNKKGGTADWDNFIMSL